MRNKNSWLYFIPPDKRPFYKGNIEMPVITVAAIRSLSFIHNSYNSYHMQEKY